MTFYDYEYRYDWNDEKYIDKMKVNVLINGKSVLSGNIKDIKEAYQKKNIFSYSYQFSSHDGIS